MIQQTDESRVWISWDPGQHVTQSGQSRGGLGPITASWVWNQSGIAQQNLDSCSLSTAGEISGWFGVQPAAAETRFHPAQHTSLHSDGLNQSGRSTAAALLSQDEPADSNQTWLLLKRDPDVSNGPGAARSSSGPR